MPRKRIGRQTPTRAVILRYRKSLGPEAVELYESTGRQARPWQKSLVRDLMAVSGKKELWKHTRFGYSVPRQNGKNEIAAIRELWGLKHGEQMLHTAHRTTTSHTAWERLLTLVEKAGLMVVSSYKAYGKEHIIVSGGGRIEFRTRTSTGGLGETYDLLVIDEAQEYKTDQESALKYIISASGNPQIILLGTPPTPISSGTVFMKFRQDVLAGNRANSGWAEWSVDKDTDPWEKDAWYDTNPSLGYGLAERTVADEINDDRNDFNIQRLGRWIQYNQQSVITEEEWKRWKAPELPPLTGRMYVGVKYARETPSVSMAIAIRTEDGKIFTEAIDCRNTRSGNGWIIEFLRAAAGTVKRVVVDGANGQQLLADDMKDARVQKPYLPTVKDIIAASTFFEAQLYAGKLCHMGQPALTQVVTNCEHRTIGSNGGYGFRSILEGADISLMDAVILACWAAEEFKERPTAQKMSA